MNSNTPNAHADTSSMPESLFLRACMRLPVERAPVWLMRQAGRYLPEYRKTRERAGSFMGLATSPELATEATLQPIDRYGLDAAILFSDILTIPDAMGLGLGFHDGEGPRFERPIRDEASALSLAVPDMEKLKYVFDATASIKSALAGRVPLIGFSGSPWTLACYMVEGQGSDDFRLAKTMLYSRPDLMLRILDINAQTVGAYLNAQIDAGAQAVMVFDSWGGMLADNDFQSFSLRFIQQAFSGVKRRGTDGKIVPRIVYTKGGLPWLSELSQCGADVVGLDWTAHLGKARTFIGDRCALQGNLDPAVLLASESAIRAQTRKVVESFGHPIAPNGSLGGHIFNLGHGIDQKTPPDAVSILVDEVRQSTRSLYARK